MREQLDQAPIGGSAALLTAISGRAGVEVVETRHRLLSIIYSLDIDRVGKTRTWVELTQSGQPTIEPGKADRFLKSLIDESRKILKKEGSDYSLDHSLNVASRKAKLSAEEGREFLRRLLGSSQGSVGSDSWMLPAKFGLLVRVEFPQFAWYRTRASTDTEKRKRLVESIRQELRNQDNIFIQFFQSDDPDEIAERLITIRSRISKALVLNLPRASRIKWAIDLPSPSLQPEYELAIKVMFGINRVQPESDGSGGYHWSVQLSGTADFVHTKSGRRLRRDSIELVQNHEIGSDEEIFDKTSAAFTQVVRLQLEEQFAGNR